MNQKKNQMNKLYKFCALLLSLAVAVFCVAVSTVTVKANDSGPTASVSSVTGTLAGYGCTDGGEYLTTYTVGGMEVSGIIELGVESVDDSLIDSSNAVVELINGPVGLNFSYNYQDFANSIAAGWDYGKNSFTVSEIAFTWNNVEDHSDPGFYEDRQWSIFGGDGSGHYTFTLQVSGITYNGSPVLGATFEVEVYIFSLAATIQQAETLTESNYTASSWSALQTALAAAKTVAANTNATLAQMYEATVALNTAIISLVSAADTTALTTEIGKAEALTESDYTASSWS
ncbi:MAG: hypothetical protein LUG61_07355, partial [Lachnospiraceae bacterium]|nr:hypothetical protein [Lachnospiraceae bacterium]